MYSGVFGEPWALSGAEAEAEPKPESAVHQNIIQLVDLARARNRNAFSSRLLHLSKLL